MQKFPTLDDLITNDERLIGIVNRVREWKIRRDNGKSGLSLILFGPYGTGKTHIAQSLYWTYYKTVDGIPDTEYRYPMGKFMTAPKFLTIMTPDQYEPIDMGRILGERIDFSSDLKSPIPVPIFVLDDVGREFSIPYIKGDMQDTERRMRYFTALDYCYRTKTSVVITTNLDCSGGYDSEFAQHVGGAVWDRLSEMVPAGYMLSFGGIDSWRMRAGGRI